MKRLGFRLFVVANLILLAAAWLDVRSTRAVPQTVVGYTCVSYIPQSWGEFKGGDQQSGLAFQDRASTLRFVTNLPCNTTPQPALEIRRTAPAN